MYTVPKEILFQNQLFIGEHAIYDGVLIIKKSAIKNIKKLASVESVLEWVKEDTFYAVPASESKEIEINCAVVHELGDDFLYKFTRSKLLVDRGQDSPLSLFVCPDLGVVKFLEDEYVFNLKLDVLYSTESSRVLIDSNDRSNWNLAVFSNSKPHNFDIDLDIIATCVLSANYEETI